jgi:hypothetical protein
MRGSDEGRGGEFGIGGAWYAILGHCGGPVPACACVDDPPCTSAAIVACSGHACGGWLRTSGGWRHAAEGMSCSPSRFAA